MSTTSPHFSWTEDNSTGNVSYTVKYRLMGDSTWVEMSTSGTTSSISGLLLNRIYDFQVTNVNNDDNPSSAISQSINITDPLPVLSPTNSALGYTFTNLSVDMDSYTCTIALLATPTVIITTHILTAVANVSDTFTGLSALTQYQLTISPAANQFTKPFTYNFTTTAIASCPDPSSATATLI